MSEIQYKNTSAVILGDDLKKLSEISKGNKLLGKKVVLTGGVWDMLHGGHLEYLVKARQSGDVLIVIVDNDELTRLRKGDDRPFDKEDERIKLIAGLRVVNYVIVNTKQFHKHDILKAVKPDVFVISVSTGSEIQDDIKQFEEFAGEVVNFEPQSSNSTSAKLLRLKKGALLEFKGRFENLFDEFETALEGKENK